MYLELPPLLVATYYSFFQIVIHFKNHDILIDSCIVAWKIFSLSCNFYFFLQGPQGPPGLQGMEGMSGPAVSNTE